jgi:hypothetical protein
VTRSSTEDVPSVASIASEVATDVTRLLRQEVDLALSEVRAEASKAVRGARSVALGAAALQIFALLASAGAVVALSDVLATRVPRLADWSIAITAGVVAVFWLVVGRALLGSGRRRLRSVSLVPRQTIESIREDIAWLRNPNA